MLKYKLFNVDFYILTYSELNRKVFNKEIKETLENLYDELFPKENLIINIEE